jgi:hypothetical protein
VRSNAQRGSSRNSMARLRRQTYIGKQSRPDVTPDLVIAAALLAGEFYARSTRSMLVGRVLCSSSVFDFNADRTK